MFESLSPSFFKLKKSIFILFFLFLFSFIFTRKAFYPPGFFLLSISLVILFTLFIMRKLSFKKQELMIGSKIFEMKSVKNVSILRTQFLVLMFIYMPENKFFSRWRVCMVQAFGLTKGHYFKISDFKKSLTENSSIPTKRINEIFTLF